MILFLSPVKLKQIVQLFQEINHRKGNQPISTTVNSWATYSSSKEKWDLPTNYNATLLKGLEKHRQKKSCDQLYLSSQLPKPSCCFNERLSIQDVLNQVTCSKQLGMQYF
ncbi:uncharacterized protein LOC143239231 [Tachypleus tridentatus]|uniref:uncharacterized protein LOC143239231 n=1 Tax=Tachypleus tridentatus TaxID=6853 RepID=UPI003FCF8E11